MIIRTVVLSQPCLPEGITFTTQAEIDNFQTNYPNCTEIEGFCYIDDNDITNLNGLSVVTSIGGQLRIRFTERLKSLSGLDNLTSIGGSLWIYINDSLTTLSGLENLSSIGEDLHIGYWEFDDGNPLLTSISALQNLVSIGGILEIANNPSLTNLGGLENLEASSITDLYIYNNTSLPSCDIQSVCDYLGSPNGSVNIYNNAIGCNNPVEVTNACGITFVCLPYGNYYFVTQDEIDNFQINYTGCFNLEGNVRITGWDEINNLSGLSVINSIEGNLLIYGTNDLTDLSGLEGLINIGGTLLIGDYNLGDNISLISFNGLENLVSIGGDLVIDRNNLLVSFSGLEGLTSIGQWFWLGNNPSLTNISSLSNLTYIGGSLLINPDWPINYSLTSLTGMENLTSIGGYLWIENMGALTSLNGLENLSSIVGMLKIVSNEALTSLSGLDNISASSIEELSIYWNSSLTTCEIQSVCDYLATPGGTISIYNNALGCNSQEEVEGACEPIGILENNSKPELSIYPNPATDKLYNTSNNGLKIEKVNIYNQLGQNVLHINEIRESFDISSLRQGIYIIELTSSELKIRQMLIIK